MSRESFKMPEDLNDRAADVWEPLFAIAKLAGRDRLTRAQRAALIFPVTQRRMRTSARNLWQISGRFFPPSK